MNKRVDPKKLRRLRKKKAKKNNRGKKKKSTGIAKKIRRRGIIKNTVKYAGYIIIGLIVAFLLYNMFNYVLALRLSNPNSTTSEGMVVGYSDVPVFPSSEYIFEGYEDNDSIQNFLSEGNVIYRLPVGTKFSDVADFYAEELPKTKWNLVLEVPLESEDKMPGQYWVKDSLGLRIYSDLNDIWYQSMTVKDAKSGLAAVVKKEIERDLLLKTEEKQKLLPDFPWYLEFPNEYVTSYTGTDITDLRSVTFKKLGSDDEILLEPVAYIGANTYDALLDSFLKKYNKRNDQSWGVANSVLTTVDEQEAISASLIDGGKNGKAVVMGNTRTTVVYILIMQKEEDPFFDYIVENITSVKSAY